MTAAPPRTATLSPAGQLPGGKRSHAFGKANSFPGDFAIRGSSLRTPSLRVTEIRWSTLPIARTLERNSVLVSRTKALRDTFPVVCRLVDERIFAYAAHEFIRRHLPEHAEFAEYGARFPDFLAGFALCREPIYLPDVARLEWLFYRAALAADAAPIRSGSLRSVAAKNAPRLRLRLHPSFGFIASPWPIDRIWRANQVDASGDRQIGLSAGGARLELSRCGEEVILRRLDAATIAFRQALADGATLKAATVLSLATDGRFDLATAIVDLFRDRAVVGFTLAPEAPP